MGVTMELDELDLPLLDQFSEEGFVDCVFRIVDVVESDTHFRASLAASYQGAKVGFVADILKSIQSGIDRQAGLIKERIYTQGVTVRSNGPESNRFLEVLACLYGLPGSKRTMRDTESFTAIALHKEEIEIAQQRVKLKLFGHDACNADENMYNESYFNLDLPNGFVYWNEKDPEYRSAIIQALSQ